MGDVSFNLWLIKKLEELDLDTEIVSDYIKGILEEEDDTNDEKLESIGDFLSEQVSDAPEVAHDILRHWAANAPCSPGKGSHMSISEVQSVDSKLSDIFSNVQTVTKQKVLSSEEKARKQDILARYSDVRDGASSDSDEDGDGSHRNTTPLGPPPTAPHGLPSTTPHGPPTTTPHGPPSTTPHGEAHLPTTLNTTDTTSQSMAGAGGDVAGGASKKISASLNYNSDVLTFKNVNADKVTASERENRVKAKQESDRKKEQDKVNKEKQKSKAEERREKEKKRTQKQERRRM